MTNNGESGRNVERVMASRKCWAFAGVCVTMLLLSGSVMGLAMMASGQTFSDLVDENAVNWKIKDVSKDPNPMNPNLSYPVYYWDYSTPAVGSDGLEVQFNDVVDEWFTVYLENVWEGDLSGGMTVTALFEIRSTSDNLPVFEARRSDLWTQVCLNFQTTGGSYDPYDLWWSKAYVVLTSYVSSATSVTLNTEITLSVTMDSDKWFNHDGNSIGFSEAIAGIHEIGFSFGRAGSVTSGVALADGDATFVLKSFVLE